MAKSGSARKNGRSRSTTIRGVVCGRPILVVPAEAARGTIEANGVIGASGTNDDSDAIAPIGRVTLRRRRTRAGPVRRVTARRRSRGGWC